MDFFKQNCIKIRGAKVHNLKNIDIDIPLGKIVAISGVSGSGKSSLALGVLYSEGSRRYLESLSTYTRRRITQSEKAKVDSIEYIPAALALHQRPNVPGIRSTFGTSTELLNSIRLLYSRCGSYRCSCGYYLEPSLNVARELKLICPNCGNEFWGLGAEEYAFNSDGACSKCTGTGFIRNVDITKLVPDESKTIKEGAVEPWNMFGISWMYRVAEELGVRVDIPFKNLTDKEKQIVYFGEEVNKYIAIPSKNGKIFELNCTYRNAYKAVEEALKKAESEKGLDRINKYLSTQICPECNGSRLNRRANSTLLNGLNLETTTKKTLGELVNWIPQIISNLPGELKEIANSISEEFMDNANALLDLGLSYISLDRASATLSTGELQRVQLARTLRNHTTGVLYVLDEPSIGLHPSNIDGLISVMNTLIKDGNSVILVDHDTRILSTADYIIEIGPSAGVHGGQVVSKGTIDEIRNNKNSLIGKYLSNQAVTIVREKAKKEDLFKFGSIQIETSPIHTVKSLNFRIPKGRLTAVTGVSGSGKTTAILESLYPAVKAVINNEILPAHVKFIEATNIKKIHLIDATPIGNNIRSTVATYSGILDDIRYLYSSLEKSKELHYKINDFSYNTGKLRCKNCDGTGIISMDVQFLPDIEMVCPQCNGLRYSNDVDEIKYNKLSIKNIMALTIEEALNKFSGIKKINNKLQILLDLGLGYLTLGESTPALSGGEAQRLKLSMDIDKNQNDSIFIFDEPSIGLHPRDVSTLVSVFQKLIERGATVIVIEHDLDLIKNADYIIDMGPYGGEQGGEIIAYGTLNEIISNEKSITGKYLKM